KMMPFHDIWIVKSQDCVNSAVSAISYHQLMMVIRNCRYCSAFRTSSFIM
ncbi:hypothetical protein L9F63_021342, partial [Diploptera punctata]